MYASKDIDIGQGIVHPHRKAKRKVIFVPKPIKWYFDVISSSDV